MGKKRNRSESFTKLGTTDSEKKSDDGDSQEEYDIDAGLSKLNNGVRCSARVIEKQEKLRRESSPAKQAIALILDHAPINQTPLNPATKHSFTSPSSSTVTAGDQPPINDLYWDQTSPPSEAHAQRTDSATTETCTSYPPTALFETKRGIEEKRKKRNWEVWSQDDKLHFFEALNEFGKDFDAIQNHLAAKLKSRSRMAMSSPNFVPKNKDQVRHFYYRTWHKIAKHLKFPKDMKRANQELYGLVNYGELRKKQRVLNGKNAAKLSELMEKGMTTIKVRGKTFRIKTPVCRAIKRMNLLDDEHSRVPCKVCLELTPKDRRAWATVQSVAHNPRICVQVPPQRTLSSVITYFEERWKTPTDRLKEQFVQSFAKKPIPRLRFIPVEQDTRTPIFKMSECTNSATISLRSYTEKVLHKPAKEPEPGSSHPRTRIPRKQSQSGNLSDSHGEQELSDQDAGDGPNYVPKFRTNSDVEEKTDLDESWCDINLEAPYYAAVGKKDDNLSGPDEKVTVTMERKSFQLPLPAHENVCSCSPSTKYHVRDRDSEDIVGHIWDDESIRRGWIAPEAGLMTLGELYLILGRCQRLSFRYCWDSDEQGKEPKLIDKLVEVARALRKRKSMRTKSYNSYGAAATTCLKCGYQFQCDQFVQAPPAAPTVDQRQPEHQHMPNRLPSPVLPQDNTPKIDPSRPSGSSHISAYPNSPPTIIITNTQGVPLERPACPSNEPPPKPFMDLTKGNRRISRINSRRFIGPRISLPPHHEQNISDTSIINPQQPFEYGGNERSVYSRMFPNNAPRIQEPGLSSDLNQQIEVSHQVSTNQTITQLPITSSELENLLKDKSNDKNVDPDNTFSLSSFMDISLPESTRLVADDVSMNVDKLLDDNTASSIGVSGLSGEKPSGLETPRKPSPDPGMSAEAIHGEQGQGPSERWMSETNELSFTNLLTTFEMTNSRRESQEEEEGVTFQSVVGEVNFVTQFNEPTEQV